MTHTHTRRPHRLATFATRVIITFVTRVTVGRTTLDPRSRAPLASLLRAPPPRARRPIASRSPSTAPPRAAATPPTTTARTAAPPTTAPPPRDEVHDRPSDEQSSARQPSAARAARAGSLVSLCWGCARARARGLGVALQRARNVLRRARYANAGARMRHVRDSADEEQRGREGCVQGRLAQCNNNKNHF